MTDHEQALIEAFRQGADWQSWRRVLPLMDWPPGEAVRKEAEARLKAGTLGVSCLR